MPDAGLGLHGVGASQFKPALRSATAWPPAGRARCISRTACITPSWDHQPVIAVVCWSARPTARGRSASRPTDLPRRVSGFNLDELLPEKGFNVARALVGTESTCVTVLQARFKLCPGLFERTLVTVAYDTIADAGDAVPRIMDRFRPIGLEGVDRCLIDDQQELGMNTSDLTELPRHTSAGGWLPTWCCSRTGAACGTATRSACCWPAAGRR